MTAPQNFKTFEWDSPFTLLLGGLHYKMDQSGFEIGMCIEEKHTNREGVAHGGVLFALADMQLAFGIQQSVPEPLRMVTVNVTMTFVEPARIGDWVVGRTEVQRTSTTLGLATCALTTNGRTVAQANGVFRITRTGPSPTSEPPPPA